MGSPALRLRGRGDRVRLRKIGMWNRDPLAELTVTCRTTVAVDKTFGESVRAARQAGRSWSEVAHALGLPSTLSSLGGDRGGPRHAPAGGVVAHCGRGRTIVS